MVRVLLAGTRSQAKRTSKAREVSGVVADTCTETSGDRRAGLNLSKLALRLEDFTPVIAPSPPPTARLPRRGWGWGGLKKLRGG